MKKLRKNMLRLAFVLCGLLLLLIAYGAYTVSVNGNRWSSSPKNSYARSKRQNVIPGRILVGLEPTTPRTTIWCSTN